MLLPVGNGRLLTVYLGLRPRLWSSEASGVPPAVAETCFSFIPVYALIRLVCMKINER